jgi:hypothetical protein
MCLPRCLQLVSSTAWTPQLLLQRSGSSFDGAAADDAQHQLAPGGLLSALLANHEGSFCLLAAGACSLSLVLQCLFRQGATMRCSDTCQIIGQPDKPNVQHCAVQHTLYTAHRRLLTADVAITGGLFSAVVFDYAQSIEEVLVEAQLPAHIQQQDICVKLGPTTLLVMVGRQRVINGCLAGRILPQQSGWKIGECAYCWRHPAVTHT